MQEDPTNDECGHLDWLRRWEEIEGDICLSEESWTLMMPTGDSKEAVIDLLWELRQHPEWHDGLEAVAIARGVSEETMIERMAIASVRYEEWRDARK